MEERLRADILREATQYQQQILVADEDDAFNVFNMFQRVTEQDVLTPKTMFEELRNDGYNVQYSRIPITDEKVCRDTCNQSTASQSCLNEICFNLPVITAASVLYRVPSQRTLTGL